MFCAQQGIAFRGHRETQVLDLSVNVGNFRSLVRLLSRHIAVVRDRLESGPKNASWLGHDIQNELVSVMAKWVLSKIIAEVKNARYYTIIADETKDVSKSEQLTIVLRYVYGGSVYEHFLGFVEAKSLNASALTQYILDQLSNLELSINNCISQCYDGASVMSGCCNGVATKILEKNPKAIYIHCWAHQLNLVLVGSCKIVAAASDFFALLQALYVFMSSSVPHSMFIDKQSENTRDRHIIQLKKLSDTRWSCRHASIKAVTMTISCIISTLQELSMTSSNSSSRAVEARGLLFQIKYFEFLLCLVMFEKIFSITGKLSDLLQAESLSYAAAASCIQATKETISGLRSEGNWQKIWDDAVKIADKHAISVSRPTRNRALPARLSDSVVTETVGNRQMVLDEHRVATYYSTIDTILEEMNRRFSTSSLALLNAMEALLPNSEKFLDVSTLLPFLNHYEIDVTEVEVEVTLAKTFLSESSTDLNAVHEVYNAFLPAEQCFPCLLKTFKIAMTIGVSTASAERSFSSLRRLKTYLRSTLSQDHLSDLALLYIERDISGQLWDHLDENMLLFSQKHSNSRIQLV